MSLSLFSSNECLLQLTVCFSIRQYALIVHDADDVAAKTYTGEIGRVGSFQNQKMYVFIIEATRCC